MPEFKTILKIFGNLSRVRLVKSSVTNTAENTDAIVKYCIPRNYFSVLKIPLYGYLTRKRLMELGGLLTLEIAETDQSP